MLRCCFDEHGNLDNDEFNQLAERLKGMIIASIRSYYLPGGDRDDLYQWGLLGLYKAVLQYDENDRYTFDFVASRNIHNMIKSAVTRANRQKHRLANEAESLHAKKPGGNDNNAEFIDHVVVSNAYDPPEVLADKESIETLYQYIDCSLSTHERTSLLLYIYGYKQQDIAKRLDIGCKVVDNALQRAKRKISQHIIRRDEHDTAIMFS